MNVIRRTALTRLRATRAAGRCRSAPARWASASWCSRCWASTSWCGTSSARSCSSSPAEEQKLRQEFKNKHAKAVNLELYKQQLKDIERSFGALLRQLPGRTEVPNLLVDISQTGLAAGLEEKLFQPQPEQRKDFYAELPIKIRLTGSYHQFGEFVSGIAALPRIVTLHDIDIKPDNKDAYDQLSLELTAKTYRYLDEDEIAAGEAEKKADVTHRPRRDN